jgi:hypothetical protein
MGTGNGVKPATRPLNRDGLKFGEAVELARLRPAVDPRRTAERFGTEIWVPSCNFAAKLNGDRSAFEKTPTCVRAVFSRVVAGNVCIPGFRTAPTMWTTTSSVRRESRNVSFGASVMAGAIEAKDVVSGRRIH